MIGAYDFAMSCRKGCTHNYRAEAMYIHLTAQQLDELAESVGFDSTGMDLKTFCNQLSFVCDCTQIGDYLGWNDHPILAVLEAGFREYPELDAWMALTKPEPTSFERIG